MKPITVESSSMLHELDLMLLQEDKDPPPPAICIVKLSTGTWSDKRGLYQRKTLSFMKRLSSGYQVLREDAGMIGAEEVIGRIINLDSCDDGLYRVAVVNESRDWETGYVDDYDYELIPVDK